MKIYIKNMVCQGTKLAVLHEMDNLGIRYSSFGLGEIDLEEDLSLNEIKILDEALRKYGLEVNFKNSKLVARIRQAVLDLIEKRTNPDTSFSYYISVRVGYNYTYLNEYYKTETGVPIEEYFLEKKNETEMSNVQPWEDVINHFKKSA